MRMMRYGNRKKKNMIRTCINARENPFEEKKKNNNSAPF